MKNIYKIIFVFILIVAVILRFWQLGNIPAGLNWDEISHGYNSYSLLLTGKDQWGIPFPLYNFRAYGDYPTTANLYLTVPFIKIFGLNSFAIRLPAAIFGTIFVLLNYLFAKIIFKKDNFALMVMFLAAISPWTVFPSRGVFQSNISEVLLLLGVYLFYISLKKPWIFLLSLLSFASSLFAYHNTRIIAVPALLLLIFFNLKTIIRQ
ncbi:MAG TPA: glycosyltransferase family 39 protein, partial [Patescibacteria group bacterium]